jgi:hypothetical protein
MHQEGFIGWCLRGDGSMLWDSWGVYLYHPMFLIAVWESHIVRHIVAIETYYYPRIFTVSHGQPIGWENIHSVLKASEYYDHYYEAVGFMIFCKTHGIPLHFLTPDQAAMWIVEEPLNINATWDNSDRPLGFQVLQANFSFNGGRDHEGASERAFQTIANFPISPTVWNSIAALQDSLHRPGYDFVGWCRHGDGSQLVELWQIADLVTEWHQWFSAIWERLGNAPCADTNLARSATMSASSAQGVRTADRANNGIREGAVTNSWSAAGIGQEWLMVDFGEQVNFNHIRIFQGGNRITGYRFEYSNDGLNWTTFHSGNRIMEATPAHYALTTPAPMQARYVRLFSESSIGVTPIVVFEFEVYFMP